MVCRIIPAFFLLTCFNSLINASKQVLPRVFCGGQDITNEPKIEARKLDGIWHMQSIKSSFANAPSIAMFFWQFQGRDDWELAWNVTTGQCKYRKFKDVQVQTVRNGPFSPCFTSQRILPTIGTADEFLYLLLTDNLLLFYRCFGTVRADKSCSDKLYAFIITKTLHITQKELNIAERKLRTFGESLNNFSDATPTLNRCPIPSGNQRASRPKYRQDHKMGPRKIYRY